MKKCPKGCVTRQRNNVYKCFVCGSILEYMSKEEMKKSRTEKGI